MGYARTTGKGRNDSSSLGGGKQARAGLFENFSGLGSIVIVGENFVDDKIRILDSLNEAEDMKLEYTNGQNHEHESLQNPGNPGHKTTKHKTRKRKEASPLTLFVRK
ncbi:hypothetical protein Tco_1189405 [Tanacetum coccineum]